MRITFAVIAPIYVGFATSVDIPEPLPDSNASPRNVIHARGSSSARSAVAGMINATRAKVVNGAAKAVGYHRGGEAEMLPPFTVNLLPLVQAMDSSSVSSANVSPSSSPVFGPVDSSPPSSPNLAPCLLDSSPHSSAPFTHPFAASTKAVKRLPTYEKKTHSPPCTPPGTFTRSVGLLRGDGCSRSLQENDFMSSGSPEFGSPLHRTPRYLDREERIWDDAIQKPFDTGNGSIDLSGQQLRTIPASIGDLLGFFNTPELSEQTLFSGRPLARVRTEPAIDSLRIRSFERTQSITDSGKERHVLKLYLASNMITSLPPQLFTVTNLVILSLRGNWLTSIPPEICRLTNLDELNISLNNLQYLPWEMRDMKIKELLVHPNPFLPHPSSTGPGHDLSHSLPRSRHPATRLYASRKGASTGSTQVTVSPVTFTLSRVPPLTEICFRLLLAPSESSTQSVIADYYDIPLSDEWNITPVIRKTLMDCVPGIIRPRKRFSMDTITLEDQRAETHAGTSTCPNPEHKGKIFLKHASERFTWETRIAGVNVGGAVPLRWRGCLQTCLDFLDANEVKPLAERQPQSPVTRVSQAEEELDVEADAVQAVDLGAGDLEMDEDDFDE